MIHSAVLARSRRQLEDYLVQSPVERKKFHESLRSIGRSPAKWLMGILVPYSLEKERYFLNELPSLLGIRSIPTVLIPAGLRRGKRSESIFVSRRRLTKFILDETRRISLRRVQLRLSSQQLTVPSKFHAFVRKNGAVLVPALHRAESPVFRVEQLLRIIQRIWDPPLSEAFVYGISLGMSAERVQSVLTAFKKIHPPKTRLLSRSDSAKRAVLLDYHGFPLGSRTYISVSARGVTFDSLEARIAHLKTLGVTDVSPFSFMLHDDYLDPRKPYCASLVKYRLRQAVLEREITESVPRPVLYRNITRLHSMDQMDRIELLRLAKLNDDAAMAKLLDLFSFHIRDQARRWVHRLGSNRISFDDAISCGQLALYRAVQNTKNHRTFIPYAKKTISLSGFRMACEEAFSSLWSKSDSLFDRRHAYKYLSEAPKTGEDY